MSYNLKSSFEIFLKGENLFNRYYVTEPGCPMKGRTVTAGFKCHLGTS
jgi:outer membrane receptor protein involved in Fe transport